VAGLNGAALQAAKISCSARFERVPTAPLDALLEQDGLLVDVLGPNLSGDLSGSWPLKDARDLRANLSSDLGRIELDAAVQEDALIATGDEGLRASLSLTPLFSQRIVGNLVPLLVDLKKDPSAEPLSISVTNFTLPLDRSGERNDGQVGEGVVTEDLIRSIAADVTIDLGEVGYRFLPGLAGSFGSAIDSLVQPQTATIPPIVLRLERGVVSYAALPLSIDGKPLPLSGRYDVLQRTFELSGELPLKYLGGKIAKNLDQARGFLDPDLAVPITLSGTLTRPSLSVRGDFLDGLIEDALSNTLQRGLERLLRKD
jgi:hypothetical protein